MREGGRERGREDKLSTGIHEGPSISWVGGWVGE